MWEVASHYEGGVKDGKLTMKGWSFSVGMTSERIRSIFLREVGCATAAQYLHQMGGARWLAEAASGFDFFSGRTT